MRILKILSVSVVIAIITAAAMAAEQKSEQCGRWVTAENGVLPRSAVVGGSEYSSSNQLFVCRVVAPNGAVYPGKFIPSFGCFIAIDGGELTGKSVSESYMTWHGPPERVEVRTGYRPEVLVADGCAATWVNVGADTAPPDAPTGRTATGEPLYICRAELTPRADAQPKGLHIGQMGWSTDHACRISWGGRVFDEARFEVLQVQSVWYHLPAWAYLPSAFVILAILALAIHFVRPLWLLAFYEWSGKVGPLGDLKLPVIGVRAADLINVVNLFAVPALVRSPRTLDAWVRLHRTAWREVFEREPTVLRCTEYVPLPCRLDDPEGGELIQQPGAALLSTIFSGGQVAEIVGTGGAGKTMLTIQLCRWAMEGAGLARSAPMLPVLIEEETTNILGTVRRKLIAGLGADAHPEFVKALLLRGRILVVFDRLSERTDATIEYVRRSDDSLLVGRLLVSTRRRIDYERPGARRLWPVPLGSASMMLFVSALLSTRTSAGVFARMAEQTDLAARLASLIGYDGRELPLTPLLVRLFVDRAVQLVKGGQPLEKLPSSIPQAYFEYLRDVNPKDPGEAHGMSDEAMLRAARLLAVICLGERFIPQDFEKSQAFGPLEEAGWRDFGSCDPVERLKLNGVILERFIGSRQYLSFTLDPVAEYLAADEQLARCKGEESLERQLFEDVRAGGEVTRGFLLALELTADLYHGTRNARDQARASQAQAASTV